MTRRRTILFLSMALALAGGSAGAAEPLKAIVRYKLVRERGSLVPPRPTNTIVFTSVVNKAGLSQYWVAEQAFRGAPGDAKRPHLWIDGRTCAALDNAILTLADLSMDDAAPLPGKLDQSEIGRFTLVGPMAPKGPPPLTVTEVMGPLYRWWRQTEPQLSKCWRVGGVEVNGKVLGYQLKR